MTVEQVQAAVGYDPYTEPLVWRRTDTYSVVTTHVQWAVYDVFTGNGQGGFCSYDYLSQVDVVQRVREMIENMNNRRRMGEAWPSVDHYRYTDWECGSVEDFANWLKRRVGL